MSRLSFAVLSLAAILLAASMVSAAPVCPPFPDLSDGGWPGFEHIWSQHYTFPSAISIFTQDPSTFDVDLYDLTLFILSRWDGHWSLTWWECPLQDSDVALAWATITYLNDPSMSAGNPWSIFAPSPVLSCYVDQLTLIASGQPPTTPTCEVCQPPDFGIGGWDVAPAGRFDMPLGPYIVNVQEAGPPPTIVAFDLSDQDSDIARFRRGTAVRAAPSAQAGCTGSPDDWHWHIEKWLAACLTPDQIALAWAVLTDVNQLAPFLTPFSIFTTRAPCLERQVRDIANNRIPITDCPDHVYRTFFPIVIR